MCICRHGEAGLTHSSFPTGGGLPGAGTKLTLSYDSVGFNCKLIILVFEDYADQRLFRF